MREYLTPDFDVTIYEIEDICLVSSIKDDNLNGGGNGSNGDGGWWG